jgi:hypothetical protein
VQVRPLARVRWIAKFERGSRAARGRQGDYEGMQHQSRESPKKRIRGGAARTERGAAQSSGIPFIIAITVLLLAGAVIANLPAFRAMAWPQYLFQSLIWIVTIAVLLSDARSRRNADRSAAARMPQSSVQPVSSLSSKAPHERKILVGLAIVLAFSVAAHYRFGKFHGDGHFPHYHELYHYYMGSKYFPELGHDGLYAATQRALIENDASFARTISLVKNLRTNQLEGQAVSTERAGTVSRLFSEDRWQQFKRDVLFFQSRIPSVEWQRLLIDHGYNATPFWTFVGSLFSAHLALSNDTLFLLVSFDLLLIGAMFFLVRYAFGLKTALLFAIFFFANFFATFDFAGGAFLRQFWIAFLIGFACFLTKHKTIPAAFCLAIAVLDRAFPLVFLLLPAVLLVKELWNRQPLRQGQLRFLSAFALFAVLLGGLSTTTAGTSAWRDWYRNIRAHDQSFSSNPIALRTLFIVNPVTTPSLIDARGDESLWRLERETLNAQSHNTLRAVRAVLLVLLILLIAREKEPAVSLGLLSLAPFLLFYPANYYGIVLAVVILYWQRCFGLAMAVLVLQLVSWLLYMAFSIPVDIEVVHWLVSACLVLVFASFLSVGLVRNARGERGFAALCLVVLLGSVLLVGGAVVADRSAGGADRGWAVLDLTPKDVRSVSAATPRLEQMTEWGNGWSRNDHLVFIAQGPGAQATVSVPAGQTGFYRLKVDYSMAPPFGVVSLRVDDQAAMEPVNLFSPRVSVLPVVYPAIKLTEGPHSFTFTVQGKDPASGGYHFAIDTIILTRLDGVGGSADSAVTKEARRASLNKAVSWVLDHPADAFDGGRNGICAEIVTFYYLLSRPQLSVNGATYLDAIRERFGKLNSEAGNRIEPDEYEMLAAVAYIARRLNTDCRAFDVAADKIRQQALSVHGERVGLKPLGLCAYLNRVNTTEKIPCHIDQSVLYQEVAERRLTGVLAGTVDRTMRDSVRARLFSIAGDVCALTDFGRESVAGAAGLGDERFWADLCEGGIRWGRETGDVLLVARLILIAKCMGVESAVPSSEAAVDYLVQNQEPDGCLGATNPHSANAFRDGVLAAIMAMASSL